MRLFKRSFIIIGIFFVWLLGPGPLKPYRQALLNRDIPQIILVLGGDIDRERVGAGLAKLLNLPLIISGGSNPEHAKWLINRTGITLDQAKLDYRAKDTLSNFTTLIDDLVNQGINHALLVTSNDHLPRALAVGNLIAGSRGIRLTSIPVKCEPNCQKESLQKKMVDIVRASTWVITGKDLKQWTQEKLPIKISNEL